MATDFVMFDLHVLVFENKIFICFASSDQTPKVFFILDRISNLHTRKTIAIFIKKQFGGTILAIKMCIILRTIQNQLLYRKLWKFGSINNNRITRYCITLRMFTFVHFNANFLPMFISYSIAQYSDIFFQRTCVCYATFVCYVD